VVGDTTFKLPIIAQSLGVYFGLLIALSFCVELQFRAAFLRNCQAGEPVRGTTDF
jgi:hypothetical protein